MARLGKRRAFSLRKETNGPDSTKGALDMRIVAPTRAWINGGTIGVADNAYIDSIGYHFRYLPTGMLTELKRIYGRRVRKEPCRDRNGGFQGFIVTLHQPWLVLLETAERWRLAHGGVICRLDIAYDFMPSDGVEPERLDHFLKTQASLRWQPKGPMLDFGETTYMSDQEGRDRHTNRNAVVYSDKPERFYGLLDISHFELKFCRALALDNEGIETLIDVLAINPKEMFEKHIRLVAFDADKARQQFLRKQIAQCRKLFKHKSNRSARTRKLLDMYEASLPKRLAQLFSRSQRDRVQACSQFYPERVQRMRTLANDTLIKPTSLAWGARPMFEIMNEIRNRGVC